jgi:hypothetical protein
MKPLAKACKDILEETETEAPKEVQDKCLTALYHAARFRTSLKTRAARAITFPSLENVPSELLELIIQVNPHQEVVEAAIQKLS